MIAVFFDPIGQALCRRTLNVVGEYKQCCQLRSLVTIIMLERLNDKYTDRIKFYLSKSDTAGSETDRQVCNNTLLCMYVCAKHV